MISFDFSELKSLRISYQKIGFQKFCIKDTVEFLYKKQINTILMKSQMNRFIDHLQALKMTLSSKGRFFLYMKSTAPSDQIETL